MSTPRKKRSTKRPGSVASRKPTAPVTQQAMLGKVRELILIAREQVAQAVNARLTILHWQIGNRVHREILKEKRADYGAEVSPRCRANWKRSSDVDSAAETSSA